MTFGPPILTFASASIWRRAVSNNGPWQQFVPQPNGALKNVATGLIVSPNGTGAQLRGGTAPSPWGGSVYTWTDYAHLPG